jgi:hypothetical protein
MCKAALFSTLLITLLANQLAHPEPVRGEERTHCSSVKCSLVEPPRLTSTFALRRAVGFPLICVTLSWFT